MTQTIGFIVGSLRQGSFTRQVAEQFARQLPEDLAASWLEIGDLPLYNEDLDSPNTPPASWTRFREAAMPLDGFAFFTPEYNRSVPAVLKNALDVGSRPRGQNVWDAKPAMVISVSPGAIGGFGANHHVRQTLTFLNMPVLQQPEAYVGGITRLIDTQGQFGDVTKTYFDSIITAYAKFLKALR